MAKNCVPYFQTQVTCITCNNEFKIGTTREKAIRIDSCSKCHPFYTGKQTFNTAKGKVERFLNKAKKQVIDKKKDKPKKRPKQSKMVMTLDNLQLPDKKKDKPVKQ